MTDTVLIVDFGSQVTQLIARRVREAGVHSEIVPFQKAKEAFRRATPKAVILSGSPHSVRQEDPPTFDFEKYHGKLPILGVCYGAQYIAHFHGGEVLPSSTREYGRANLQYINGQNPLFTLILPGSQVWMSHADTIASIAPNFEVIASTDTVKVAAYQVTGTQTYAIQFHPEVTHSVDGKQLLFNFLVDICGCKQDWTADSFVETTIAALKEKLGNDAWSFLVRPILLRFDGAGSPHGESIIHHALARCARARLHFLFLQARHGWIL